MNRIFFGFLLILNYVAVSAQQDSIYIEAEIKANQRQITVNQDIVYTNISSTDACTIKLLNWTAAYKTFTTPLAKRKVEDRKSDLYFAKSHELGSVENLEIKIEDKTVASPSTDDENIFIPLSKSLKPGEQVKVSLQYVINLPLQKFTGYGSDGKKCMLKYFFIVPDRFADDSSQERYFIDIEENQSPGIYWKVNLNIPPNYYSQSNLKEIQTNYFEGSLNSDPEFLISENNFSKITTRIDGEKTEIDFRDILYSEITALPEDWIVYLKN